MLIRSVCAGRDPTSGRQGNYFAHVFTDTPAGFDALDAIRTWGSNDWKAVDDGAASELPSPDTPPRQTLVAADAQSFLLADIRHRQWAVFCLHVVLLPINGVPLYLVADCGIVAHLIHVVALCLPQTWLQCLSFSTYERDPTGLNARIVGTDFNRESNCDLPDCFYARGRYSLNTQKNRQSPARCGAYARRTIGTLAEEGPSALEVFMDMVEGAAPSDVSELDAMADVGDTDSIALAGDRDKQAPRRGSLLSRLLAACQAVRSQVVRKKT